MPDEGTSFNAVRVGGGLASTYAALAFTCALFVAVGHARRTRTQFYLGSGRYNPIVSAISIVAAFTGGGALINTTALAAKFGPWAFFDVVSAVSGLLVAAALVFAGVFGRRFSASFFDIVSDAYDRRAVAIHYVQIVFLYTLVIAAQLRAMATIAGYVQIEVWLAVALSCVTVAIYAFRGFDAVTRTDIAQLALMAPMYVVLVYKVIEPAGPVSSPTHQTMPTSLAIALWLPLIFLPISQEIHQRSAAVEMDRGIAASYVVAALTYGLLGSILVIVFCRSPHMNIGSLILGDEVIVSVIIAVGVLAAILSTLDTSTNIASHALQKLRPFGRFHPALVQVALLAVGCCLFFFFETVLSLILFAMFVYIAGPALTFIGVHSGIRPRTSASFGAAFCCAQAFFHFGGGAVLTDNEADSVLPLADPIQMGIAMVLLQASILAFLAWGRRNDGV